MIPHDDDFDDDLQEDDGIDIENEDAFPEEDGDYLDEEDLYPGEYDDPVPTRRQTISHTTNRTHGFRENGEDDQYDTELLNYKKSFSNTEFLKYILIRIRDSDLSPECKRQFESIANNFFSEAAQLGNYEDTTDIYLRLKQALTLVSAITTPSDKASKAFLEISNHLLSHSFMITTRATGHERERMLQLVTDRSETITRSTDEHTRPADIGKRKTFLGKIFG